MHFDSGEPKAITNGLAWSEAVHPLMDVSIIAVAFVIPGSEGLWRGLCWAAWGRRLISKATRLGEDMHMLVACMYIVISVEYSTHISTHVYAAILHTCEIQQVCEQVHKYTKPYMHAALPLSMLKSMLCMCRRIFIDVYVYVYECRQV